MPIENRVILAAAGSRKTEYIVESALAVTDGHVLITTYTQENQRQIIKRIEQKAGVIPSHITVMGWLTFLITHCAKPYQRALTGEPLVINGLNFMGKRNRFTSKSVRPRSYFLDSNCDMYRDGVADFVATLDSKTRGAVIGRLKRIFSYIFVDEAQDLVGYDLDVIDLLLKSGIKVMLVGDPRQFILATNMGPRNKKFRGAGLASWFGKRSDICILEVRRHSYRCNQDICDFADALYPTMPTTTSMNVESTGHDGIFKVARRDVASYLEEHQPVTILRENRNADTEGQPAMNFGVAKGSTFDRVLIFPTQPMLKYLEDRDAAKLKAPARLYVAVTRARFSVAFVVPNPK